MSFLLILMQLKSREDANNHKLKAKSEADAENKSLTNEEKKMNATHIIKSIFFTLLILSLAHPSFAEAPPTLPPSFNFQGVLMDEAGNILSGKDTVDLTVGIKDTLGDFKFLEQHLGLPLINGAVSFLVGTGTPLEVDGEIKDLITALSPETGDKILVIQVSDQTIPQEEIFLSSVPYASYAGSVLFITNDSITTDSIANQTITYEDLSEVLTDWIKETAGTGSEAASIEARSVTLENTFTNISGDNVQKGFEAIDAALNLGSSNLEAEATAREEADEALEDQIEQEVSDRQAADESQGDTLQDHIDTDINSAHPGEITGSTIADGTITPSDMASTNISQWTNDLGYITDGNQGWDNSYNYVTLTDIENDFVNTTGDTMSGTLTMNADINMADGKLVDGVDISEVLADQVPIQAGAFAYGTMDGTNVVNSYNMSSTVSTGGILGYCGNPSNVGDYAYTVTFTNSRTNSNYIVLVTSTSNARSTQVTNKTQNGFSVRLYDQSWIHNGCMQPGLLVTTVGTFDFVVYAND